MANKGRELISRLTYKPCDLIVLTEIWLDQTIESSEIFTRSFEIHRRDRTRHGGGILRVSILRGTAKYCDAKSLSLDKDQNF